MRCCSYTWLAAVGLVGVALTAFSTPLEGRMQEAPADEDRQTLGALSVWDDGFAEMCYYDAEKTIYGKPRAYTNVHILVREWFDPAAGIKTDNISAPSAVPVFKFNICEEIPTENYNYRLMRTLITQRYTLAPQKLAASSQEWCGTSYKHVRWTGPQPGYRSFSYFEGEADQAWELPEGAVPFETVLIAARDLADAPGALKLKLLPPMDSTHGVTPRVSEVTLRSAGQTQTLRTPAGAFKVREVSLGDAGKLWVEVAAPHRLVRYQLGSQSGTLRAVERRAYWDRGWKSSAHPVNQAP